jgi:enterochelin esterase-like enzyme
MITSILEEMNSPTRQRSHRTYEFSEFETEIMDDAEVMHKVKIEYEWTPYYGLGHEKSIWSFDYSCETKPAMSEKDLRCEVRDAIHRDAGCTV